MIQLLKQFLERRRVRKIFSRVVSPAHVEDLLHGKADFRTGQLDERTLEVAIVLVGGLTPGEVAQNISRIVSLAHELNMGHDSTTGPLIVFCSGRLLAEKPNPEQRLAFVAALRSQMDKSVRIVHGAGTGHVGLLGSSDWICNYSFLMPNFIEALRVLVSLSDGDVREMPFN